MSTRTFTEYELRPYKIEVYGLQDDFIGTLQSYNDNFIGQLNEPKITINSDGTQSITFSIPKYITNPKTNAREINPRWQNNIATGILAENTRVLKAFVLFQKEGSTKPQDYELKVFPFIIDKIVDTRDEHYTTIKEVTGSGLAFAELGKHGYKLELTKEVLELEYEKDQTIRNNINYWLDKVFPNEKDSNGKIIKWLTPWCYEIRMDWSFHADKTRAADKIYEDSYVSAWEEDETGKTLVPAGFKLGEEKQRTIDCYQSNKYNITQSIAEAFEVFCHYEYKCDQNGRFVREYYDTKIDEGGNEVNDKVWTGRKVVFYNYAIKQENPFVVDYQTNLQNISRTSDSTEIYTKMYVTPSQSDAMENGYITIADTKANPLMDEFILNFDYFDSINAISAYQKQFIEKYKTEIRRLNLALKELAPSINTKTVLLNEYKAQAALADKQKQSAQQEYNDYDALRNNEFIERQVDRTKVNPVSIIFVDEGSVLKGSLHFDGVDSSSIKLYYTRDCEDKEDNLINVEDRPIIVTKKVPNIPDTNKNRFYAYKDQYGQVLCLYCHPANEHVENNKNSLYATLSYYPVLKYDSICAGLKLTEEQYTLLEAEYVAKQEQTQKELEELEAKQKEYLDKKDELNNELERILGPLLREGYWTPDEYQDPRQDYSVDYTMKSAINQFDVPSESGFFFDTELFDYEDKEYYEITEDVGQIEKKYFPYLPLDMSDTGTVQKWIADERDISKLNLRVKKNVYEATIAETWVERFEIGNKLKFTYNGKTYYFTVSLTTPVVENDKVCLYPDDTEENGFYITVKAEKQTVYGLDATVISNTDQNYDQIADITKLLSGGSSYFGDKILHLNAGYIFAYLKKKVQSGNSISYKAIPVILFNDDKNQGTYFDLEVPSANIITYCFEDDAGDYSFELPSSEKFTLNTDKFPICYPRIVLREENVLSGSDALKIYPHTMAEFGKDEEGNELEEIGIEPLTKYYDYTVLMRDDDPHITFKINSKNFFNQISDYKYHINYQTSRANELLYLDAKNVSVDNAFPKYSYELSMSAVPDKMNYIRVGQMAYINDPLLGVRAASGYLNEITYDLSSPQNDEMVVQNYKTKFEDLFSVITASSEAMKQNERNYNIAAGKFEATGTISGDVLQQSINNNNLFLDYSLTGVEVDPTQGIILTNSKPYANGAYGQVILQGGGIFLSNSLDSNGRRIWSTGLTPNGLNAKLITAGQLDTNLIRIFAGDEMAFQWNSEGILAYKYDADGKAQRKNYVKFSQYGLQCIDENLNEAFANYEQQLKPEMLKQFPVLEQGKAALVSLNWDGLTLRDRTGQTTLQLDKDSGSIFMTGTISSMNYSGDTVIGQGWQINQDGNAVFNNVYVRGTIAASVFEYKETSAVGGEMYLAPTAIIDSNISQNAEITLEIGKPFTIKLKGVKLIEAGKKHYGREWTENDIIGLTATLETNDEILYSIRNYRMHISSANDGTILTGMINISGAEQNLFYDKNNTQIAASEVIDKTLIPSGQWNLIYLGTQNGNDVSKEGILFTAIADKAPYIDFYGADAKDDNDNLPRVRIGNLNGLKDLPNFPKGLNLKGYGLYGENVYLRGGIEAQYGKIGNLEIIDGAIKVVNKANAELEDKDTSLSAEGLSFGGKGLLLTGNNIKVYGDSKIELKTGTQENATNSMILGNNGIQILSGAAINIGSGENSKIVLNENGVSLTGSSLILDGSNLTLSADSKLTLDGGAIDLRATSGALTMAGASVSITSDSIFTVNSTNFILEEGGKTTIKAGEIGGWKVEGQRIFSGAIDAVGGDGETYNTWIVLNSNPPDNMSDMTSDNTYSFWVGARIADNAPFKITKDGLAILSGVKILNGDISIDGKTLMFSDIIVSATEPMAADTRPNNLVWIKPKFDRAYSYRSAPMASDLNWDSDDRFNLFMQGTDYTFAGVQDTDSVNVSFTLPYKKRHRESYGPKPKVNANLFNSTSSSTRVYTFPQEHSLSTDAGTDTRTVVYSYSGLWGDIKHVFYNQSSITLQLTEHSGGNYDNYLIPQNEDLEIIISIVTGSSGIVGWYDTEIKIWCKP